MRSPVELIDTKAYISNQRHNLKLRTNSTHNDISIEEQQ